MAHATQIKKKVNDHNIAAIQAEMDELEKRIAEQERMEEEGLEKFETDCKSELKKKLDVMTEKLKVDTTDRFVGIDERMDVFRKDNIGAIQTDVLRTNKIIRDVSRSLGAQWKEVFVFVMAGMPKEEIDAEVAAIEGERPFMQAYKALMRWKELKAENFDLGQLIEALNIWDKPDLAKHVEAVLYSEGDSLLTITHVGSGIASGSGAAAAAPPSANGADNTGSGAEEGAAAKPRPVMRVSQAASATADPLNDGSLLRMSKKIGSDWLALATMLGVAEEDVEEIKANEGMTYQGAFKALWTWRDRTQGEKINHQNVLREALKACKLDKVAEEYLSS